MPVLPMLGADLSFTQKFREGDAMATNATSGAAKVETVTLRQLAEGLSESSELPKKQVMGMLEEMIGDITKHLKRGARIRIGGLKLGPIPEGGFREMTEQERKIIFERESKT